MDDAGLPTSLETSRALPPWWAERPGEAGGLLTLLADREARVYRRCDRWWEGLPRLTDPAVALCLRGS